MEIETILKFITLLAGFYMAWNIGANDVSNAMGTSVGSGALTLRRAVLIAAVLEFCGAFFVGGTVSETIQRDLIDLSAFIHDPRTLIYGMCGALMGTGIWLHVASYFGLPVSTTHAIVGAIIGFGMLTMGWEGVQWHTLGSIALSWVIAPVLSGIVAYVIFSLLQRNILFALNPTFATKRFAPLLLFIVFTTFSLSLVFNGIGRVHLAFTVPQALLISLGVGSFAWAVGLFVVKRLAIPSTSLQIDHHSAPFTLISLEKAIKHLRRAQTGALDERHDQMSQLLAKMHELKTELLHKTSFSERTSEYHFVEKVFAGMQIISACFVAFAHGANDVANAIAPVAAVWGTIQQGTVSELQAIPSWLLIFGGVGIVIGLATWGWRVIETIGRKITELTPSRGFCAEFGAALTILLASKMGLPISTTHCLVGAVLGVGLARGIRALNMNTLKEIALSWVITLPASALMSILCYFLLRLIFS